MTTEREIDRELVERVKVGDQRAFDTLAVKYQRKLYRVVHRFVRDASEAEDVTQEALLKAYRALPTFRNDSAFYTWLYRIGINTAKNYLVAMHRRAPTSTDFAAEDAETFDDAEELRDGATPESLMMTRQLAATVSQSLDEMPDELRTAVTLREVEGLSYEDIATIQRCPIGTVRSRIFRGREEIAARLRPQLGTSANQRW